MLFQMRDRRSRIMFLILFTVLSGTVIQSCSVMSFTPSSKRKGSRYINLSPDLKLKSTGMVFADFASLIKSDFFPAGFRIDYREKIIYIDPLCVDDPVPADYIFITHGHADHCSLPDIKKLTQKETVIIAPARVAKKLKGFRVRRVKPGDWFPLGDIKCEVVRSYNRKKGAFSFTVHKKSAGNAGYILSFGRVRIYHAGDTDFIPETEKLKDITVALVPVGTGNTAMDPVSAAQAVNMIKPLIAVPMHYDPSEKGHIKFKGLADRKIKVRILHAENSENKDGAFSE